MGEKQGNDYFYLLTYSIVILLYQTIILNEHNLSK